MFCLFELIVSIGIVLLLCGSSVNLGVLGGVLLGSMCDGMLSVAVMMF